MGLLRAQRIIVVGARSQTEDVSRITSVGRLRAMQLIVRRSKQLALFVLLAVASPAFATFDFELPLSNVSNSYLVTTQPGGASGIPGAVALCGGGDGFYDPCHAANQAFYSIDFDSSFDSMVVAAAPGFVVRAGLVGGYNTVTIFHGDGYFTEYGEFSTLGPVSVGDYVHAGDVLGELLASNVGGNHLHFQVKHNPAVADVGLLDPDLLTAVSGMFGSGLSTLSVSTDSTLGTVTVDGLLFVDYELKRTSNLPVVHKDTGEPISAVTGLVLGNNDTNDANTPRVTNVVELPRPPWVSGVRTVGANATVVSNKSRIIGVYDPAELQIVDGGSVNLPYLTVGSIVSDVVDAVGSVTVSGIGSSLTVDSDIQVASQSSRGNLVVEDEAEVASFALRVGEFGSAASADGLVSISDGGRVDVADFVYVHQGSISVTGGGSFVTASRGLGVGYFTSGDPTMTISDGATVDISGQHPFSTTYIGASANGTVTVTGAGSLLLLQTGRLYVGSRDQYYSTGYGVLDVHDSGQVIVPAAYVAKIHAGSSFAGTGIIRVTSGGSFVSTGILDVGTNGQGYVVLDNGTLSAESIFIGPTSQISGVGTLIGNVYSNGGIISPGLSPGQLSVNGNLTVQGGALVMEVAGADSALHDVLDVSGVLDIQDGQVSIEFVDGFVPAVDSEINYLSAGSILVSPTVDYSVAGLPSGLVLDVSTPGTFVTLLDTDGDSVADSFDNCSQMSNPEQRDTNADGYGNVCDPDLDDDGVVNATDLGELKLAFFATSVDPHWNANADFNGDGVVNAVDLGVMKLFFFGPPGPGAQ